VVGANHHRPASKLGWAISMHGKGESRRQQGGVETKTEEERETAGSHLEASPQSARMAMASSILRCVPTRIFSRSPGTESIFSRSQALVVKGVF
jgi:hypothetical protein